MPRKPAAEVIRPSLFGIGIITAVYLPIFALTGIEGKLFHPMAITVVLALTAAMLLSLTFVPAAVALFLGGRVQEHENWLMRALHRSFEPAIRWSLAHRIPVVGAALVVVALSGLLATRLGTEFIPGLDEGDVAVHALRIPGTSLTQAVQMQQVLERRIAALPEVERVFSRIGTAEIANDPMPPSMADTFVMIKPREAWPDPRKSKAVLVADIEAVARSVPGNNYEFTQPIQMRMNELISGVRADVAIKVNGDDLDTLNRLAARAAGIARGVEGAADVRVEETTGLPMLVVSPDRQSLSRYGLNPGDVQRTVSTAVGGTVAGEFIEGDRRTDIVVVLPEQLRQSPEWLEDLPIPRGPHANEDEVSRARQLGRG